MDDSDNENYNENYNGNYNENYDTNNVVVPPRTMHIQNNINDMINNIERDMLLKKSGVVDENGGIVTVDADPTIIITGYVIFFLLARLSITLFFVVLGHRSTVFFIFFCYSFNVA